MSHAPEVSPTPPRCVRGALLIAALALLAATGCRPRVEVAWAPAHAVAPDDDRWPDAKAVVLLDDTHLIDVVSHDTSYAEWRFHRIIRLRSRDALELADLRIELWSDQEIGDFLARSIAPDGTVKAIDAGALSDAPVTEGGEEKARVVVASIPGAQVGGVIEYSYSIRADYPLHAWQTDYAKLTNLRGLPIVRARMRITVNSIIKYAARIYNTRQPIEVIEDGNLRHLVWQAEDIAPPPDEEWAPSDDAWPRLVFKVKAFLFKSWRRDITTTWGDVLRTWTRRLYGEPDRLYAGYDPPPLPACDGDGRVDCLARAALAVARERAPFDALAGGFGGTDPLRKVLERGTADHFEKAVLVGRLLRDAGLEVDYAFGVRRHTRELDLDYPHQHPINHLILRLPKQAGLDAPVWLDPACEHCAPGELSDWSLGASVFLMGYEAKALDSDTVTGEHTLASGRPARANRVHNAFTMTLEPDGTAAVTLVETYEGLRAVWYARDLRRQSADARRKAAEARVADLDRRAVLDEAPDPTCDRAAGECTRRLVFRIPAYAIADGDELLVPLSLLHGSGRFSVPGEKRTRDMVLPTSESFEETLALTPPAGFAFVDGPTPFEARSDAFETRFEIEAGDTVRVRREARRRAGRFPPAAHGARVEALRQALRTRETRLRLRRAP